MAKHISCNTVLKLLKPLTGQTFPLLTLNQGDTESQSFFFFFFWETQGQISPNGRVCTTKGYLGVLGMVPHLWRNRKVLSWVRRFLLASGLFWAVLWSSSHRWAGTLSTRTTQGVEGIPHAWRTDRLTNDPLDGQLWGGSTYSTQVGGLHSRGKPCCLGATWGVECYHVLRVDLLTIIVMECDSGKL